jgi:hypothetical protein
MIYPLRPLPHNLHPGDLTGSWLQWLGLTLPFPLYWLVRIVTRDRCYSDRSWQNSTRHALLCLAWCRCEDVPHVPSVVRQRFTRKRTPEPGLGRGGNRLRLSLGRDGSLPRLGLERDRNRLRLGLGWDEIALVLFEAQLGFYGDVFGQPNYPFCKAGYLGLRLFLVLFKKGDLGCYDLSLGTLVYGTWPRRYAHLHSFFIVDFDKRKQHF